MAGAMRGDDVEFAGQNRNTESEMRSKTYPAVPLPATRTIASRSLCTLEAVAAPIKRTHIQSAALSTGRHYEFVPSGGFNCISTQLSSGSQPATFMPKVCPRCQAAYENTAHYCYEDGTELQTRDEADGLINARFCDRYVVVKRLGRGGMGTVFLANDERLPQQVAIKVLRQQIAADPAVIARFRQEAEAACRINHDRVARVFDFGFLPDGRAFLVMEYVDGQTLRDVLRVGPLDPHDVVEIVRMIAEGLSAAHRLSILHRDLKPENVMILDEPGAERRLKVLDFGIARVMDREHTDELTQEGDVLGTPFWMSPEQLLGEKTGVASDVYALGLLSFVLLTGHRAFTAPTRQAEKMAPLTQSPREIRTLVPSREWPPELQTLFNQTLQRDPAGRPATASGFASSLAVVRTEPSVALDSPIASRFGQQIAPSAASNPKGQLHRDCSRRTENASRLTIASLSNSNPASVALRSENSGGRLSDPGRRQSRRQARDPSHRF